MVSSSPVHVSETRSSMLEVRVVYLCKGLTGSLQGTDHKVTWSQKCSHDIPRHLSHQDARGPAHAHNPFRSSLFLLLWLKKKAPWPKATWRKKGVLCQLRVLGHSLSLKGSQGRSSNIHSQEQRVAILPACCWLSVFLHGSGLPA